MVVVVVVAGEYSLSQQRGASIQADGSLRGSPPPCAVVEGRGIVVAVVVVWRVVG